RRNRPRPIVIHVLASSRFRAAAVMPPMSADAGLKRGEAELGGLLRAGDGLLRRGWVEKRDWCFNPPGCSLYS
ncbi:MAG: hypothetical protein KGL04_04070, partial [Elusimicrobia bacterium]|nr:hypothetical protein [Elusimicrobiota bacterium]